ncbi:ATP-grasp domain-containing protein [Streptomyces sp. TBY4]|uniref:ATP-grasp domain-containing protein n=1 Tax=Streptomyces sp. TBY4 TaxID=2962030 RepID=UPI0020B70B28|nr:ATP-grasp domain-containing protein [Streptomyces sp. TBY4]MCP3755585.1 ATP-grasp domain-containing protein [Streptomyces sp. TBY4]
MDTRPVIIMVGWNNDWLHHLDGWLPDGSVVVFEERDLYEGKRLADLPPHPVVREVVLTSYHQSDAYRDAADQVAKTAPVQAVLPALEYSVEAAADLAERFGLPGAGRRAAAALRDKLLLRETTSAAGIPNPRFAEVSSAAELAAFAEGGPCVLKPANRQASLGVLLLDAGDDLGAAWAECTQVEEGVHLANRPMTWRYLAEERLSGTEYSAEALVRDGRIVFHNVTLKRTHPGRHPVELGHLVPAPAAQGVDLLPGLMQNLVDATGYSGGLLHAEWIVTERGPVLIECAGRLAGDWIPDLIRLSSDVNLFREALSLLCGVGEDPVPVDRGGAAVRFIMPHDAGEIAAIDGVEEAAALPGIQQVRLVRRVGETLGGVESSWSRVGAVIAAGESPADAEKNARSAVDQISISLRTAVAIPA